MGPAVSSLQDVTVLVADDDEDIRAVVAFTLRRAGFTVVAVHDGSTALEHLEVESFKLAVLDVNMPKADGFAVCSHIRRRSRMPVIMLSARDSDADIVHALEIGADDYIKKPFSPATLVARVQALLRRSAAAEVTKIDAGDVTLDVGERTLEIAQLKLELTPLEASLLRSLFEQRGRLVPMEQLATVAWGRAGAEERHALRQCMHRLRRKLEARTGSSSALETVRGGGYRWAARSAP